MKFGNEATFDLSQFWERVNMRLAGNPGEAVVLLCQRKILSFIADSILFPVATC